MKTLSLKKRLMLLTGSLLIGIIMVSGLIVWPVMNSINKLGENIAQTELYLEDQYLRSQKMQRSIRELDDVEKFVQKFSNFTVPPDADLELIQGLEALALLHNIDQNLDIQYKEDPQRGRSGVYTVSFLNHGIYQDHIEYLRTLEELPYYVHIAGIKMERRASVNEKKQSLVTLTFTANIYASDT